MALEGRRPWLGPGAGEATVRAPTDGRPVLPCVALVTFLVWTAVSGANLERDGGGVKLIQNHVVLFVVAASLLVHAKVSSDEGRR